MEHEIYIIFSLIALNVAVIFAVYGFRKAARDIQELKWKTLQMEVKLDGQEDAISEVSNAYDYHAVVITDLAKFIHGEGKTKH